MRKTEVTAENGPARTADTKIKICGLTRAEDVETVNRCLPDFCGFICSPSYRRSVPRGVLEKLSEMVDPRIRKVGVFVNEPQENILDYVNSGLIGLVQLHGQENADYLRDLRKKLDALKTKPGKRKYIPVIRAFRITDEQSASEVSACPADFVLLDGGAGSGRKFDWGLIRGMGREFFLAGGITPENAQEAIRRFHPFALDVSSGVETEGVKDPEKIRKMVEMVRGCAD